MLKVGLTGGYATGKSFVAGELERRGCYVISADRLGHQVLEPGGPAYVSTVALFGTGIIGEDGRIDRKKVAGLVFQSPKLLKQLEAIVHPAVFELEAQLLGGFADRQPDGIAVIEAAILIETGRYAVFDRLVLTVCSEETQILRGMKRDGLTREQVRSRLDKQMSSEDKRRYAHYIVNTDAPKDKTKQQIETIYADLRRVADGRSMRTRIFLLALVFTLACLWLTSRANWSVQGMAAPLLRAASGWSESSSVHGAGFTPDEQNNIDIYKAARLATVYITSTAVRRDFFYQPVASQSLGSGFLINENGFIMTNFHVVSGSSRIQVTLSDQSQYYATALDTDRSDDLALIKINPKRKVDSLRLGDSEHLQVGQKVLAIGNPFGLEGTLTVGVVSSIGRAIEGENEQRLEGMIQTDAAINGGNSGGPLLDSNGTVVGINTAILGQTNIGIGFALPINRAKALLADYQAGRVTERPKIGSTSEYVAGDLAEALGLPRHGGLLVQTVVRGSSEEEAGLRGAREVVAIGNVELGIGGDLIVAVDGQPADRQDALVRAISRKRVGDVVTLTILRNGRTVTLPVKLLRAPADLG